MKNSKSTVFKRQHAVLQLLAEKKSMDVETIARKLNVSTTTIRRDLDMFEKQHLIRRFHGGARLIEGTLKEEDSSISDMKVREDREQKEAIASYAAGLIEDGDTVFMNSSTTTLRMLDYLKGKHVIIVTNNCGCFGYPKDNLVDIIFTGGELYPRRHSLVGEFALQTLGKIIANKAFIGVGGISVDAGITTSVLPETAVNATMMRRCQGACYILAATPKIGREHNFLSFDIDKVNCLVTCKGADQKEITSMKSRGIEVVELDYERAEEST